jgi:hypothetical protein
MKVREIFEYELYNDETGEDITSLEENVFIIKDYIECVDDMCCPFWDGFIKPDIYNHKLEIIEK